MRDAHLERKHIDQNQGQKEMDTTSPGAGNVEQNMSKKLMSMDAKQPQSTVADAGQTVCVRTLAQLDL